MSKHHHLPHLSWLVGFLVMTVSAGAGQVNAPAGPFNSATGPFMANSPFNTTNSPFNTAAGQVNTPTGPFKTAKPGESVERHLSDDQKFREWSLDPTVTDDINRDIKRIKVCRVEDVC